MTGSKLWHGGWDLYYVVLAESIAMLIGGISPEIISAVPIYGSTRLKVAVVVIGEMLVLKARIGVGAKADAGMVDLSRSLGSYPAGKLNAIVGYHFTGKDLDNRQRVFIHFLFARGSNE
jgi:hypothetical protein